MIKVINGTCYSTSDLEEVKDDIIAQVQERWTAKGGYGAIDFGRTRLLVKYSQDERMRWDRVSSVSDDLTMDEGLVVGILLLPRRKFLKISALQELGNLGFVPLENEMAEDLKVRMYLSLVNQGLRKGMLCPSTKISTQPVKPGLPAVDTFLRPLRCAVRVGRRADPAQTKAVELQSAKIHYCYLIREAHKVWSANPNPHKIKKNEAEKQTITTQMAKCMKTIQQLMKGD